MTKPIKKTNKLYISEAISKNFTIQLHILLAKKIHEF